MLSKRSNREVVAELERLTWPEFMESSGSLNLFSQPSFLEHQQCKEHHGCCSNVLVGHQAGELWILSQS